MVYINDYSSLKESKWQDTLSSNIMKKFTTNNDTLNNMNNPNRDNVSPTKASG